MLSAEEMNQIIPAGFARGFVVLSETGEFIYSAAIL